MKVAVQTDNLKLFLEAVESGCTGVRLGSEFCEQLLPTKAEVESAYVLACERGKEFVYVTPRLSNGGIEKLKAHLPLLSEMSQSTGGPRPSVVVNDFGALNILCHYPHLRARLGRNLFLVPARSAWADRHVQSEGISTEVGAWLHALYSTTSLNYQATIDLYRSHGCRGADVDWLPRILPSLRSLAGSGLDLSVHLHLVPVTFTRRCHMARFLGERSPETCSRPCLSRALVLKNEALGDYELDFVLGGNTVYRLLQPSREDIAALEAAGVCELVLTLNPITRIDTVRKIDEMISDPGMRIDLD